MRFQELRNPSRDKVVFALAVAFVAHMADFLSTVFAIKFGAEEANPIVNSVIQAGGNELLFIYKLSGVLWFFALSYWNKVLAFVLAVPFLVIAAHNVRIGIELAGW